MTLEMTNLFFSLVHLFIEPSQTVVIGRFTEEHVVGSAQLRHIVTFECFLVTARLALLLLHGRLLLSLFLFESLPTSSKTEHDLNALRASPSVHHITLQYQSGYEADKDGEQLFRGFDPFAATATRRRLDADLFEEVCD